jgi:hypothetical protein
VEHYQRGGDDTADPAGAEANLGSALKIMFKMAFACSARARAWVCGN